MTHEDFRRDADAFIGRMEEVLFHTPRLDPFDDSDIYPQEPIMRAVKSEYISNNYNIPFNVKWWRGAVDRAIDYADLTYLDTLYSWCIQSSPFLVSLINKRLLPAQKRKFAIRLPDKEIWWGMTEALNDTRWWKDLISAVILSEIYGVNVTVIDPKKDISQSYPIRNIDILNKAIREGTFTYHRVTEVSKHANIFYFQPNNSQDLKLGLMQQVSRVMISMIRAGNDWAQANERYAYPTVVAEFANGNAEAKEMAMTWAKNAAPGTIPVTMFNESLDKAAIPAFRITPVNTQMYPESFRSYKEIMDKYEGYIMQLFLGGTLLGQTEKNTNSEQLAELHYGLYESILDYDAWLITTELGRRENMRKLATLFGIPLLAECDVVELPDEKISLKTFKAAGDIAARQGLSFTADAFEKIGMEATDIDWQTRQNSWVPKDNSQSDGRPE